MIISFQNGRFGQADSSGNGHDGNYVGTFTLGAPGLAPASDASANFDPDRAGYVATGPLNGIVVTGIDLWFETASPTKYRFIFSLHESQYDRLIIQHETSGTIGIQLDRERVVLRSDAAVSLNEPHYLALWYEPAANTTYLMIDGVVQQNSYPGDLLSVTDPEVLIGANKYKSTTYKRYHGLIDEVAVYDTAVNAGTFAHRTAVPPYAFSYDANGNRTSFFVGEESQRNSIDLR